jgi:hypothetical protein
MLKELRARGRNRWLLLLLALLLITQTACLSRGDTRATIQAQLKAADSVWAKAVPADFRSNLSKYANAPVHRYHLTYDPETRKESGTAEILFTNNTDHALPTLYLRTMAKVWGAGTDSDFSLTDLKVDGKRADFTVGKTLVTVPLAQPLPPGESVRLTYAATVTLPKLSLGGVAKVDTSANLGLYGAGADVTSTGGFPALLPNGEDGKQYDALPENEFTDAGYAGLEEIWLTLPADWTVIAQGTLVEETPAKQGQKTAHITCASQITQPGGMVLITKTMTRQVAKAGAIEVRTYTDKINSRFADEIMKEVQGALQTFQAAYGPVPLQKLDVVLMPVSGFSALIVGGGLIVISTRYASDDRNLVDMNLSPAAKAVKTDDRALNRHRVIYHEVSHAWWADLVGVETTAETWLVEAMAEASSIYASEQLDGAAAGNTARIMNIAAYWKRRAAGMKDAPIGLHRLSTTTWTSATPSSTKKAVSTSTSSARL